MRIYSIYRPANHTTQCNRQLECGRYLVRFILTCNTEAKHWILTGGEEGGRGGRELDRKKGGVEKKEEEDIICDMLIK